MAIEGIECHEEMQVQCEFVDVGDGIQNARTLTKVK